jgi:hypothetical protein
MRSQSEMSGRDGSKKRNGFTKWIALALVPALIALAKAGEDRPDSAVPAKPSSDQADSNGKGPRIRSAPDNIAGTEKETKTHLVLKPKMTAVPARTPARNTESASIERAIRAIADCRARYEDVDDYTCTFYKRERIDGRMTPLNVMEMKARTKPQSIYLKFQQPARGREAIYIAGRNNGKVLAHEVGLVKLVAGTLELAPTSARAMEDCRHPITEAGIGPLIETLAKRWSDELNSTDSKVVFHENALLGDQRCTLIETIHSHRRPHLIFHKVRVYIDQNLGLPVRFEAYDWPKLPRSEPDLVEEYAYTNVRLNVGLREIDFDVNNPVYSFGRF